MRYRKEIDGLRALAVVPLILYDAGISFFSGGYVGIDIFFVISGYLITSIILEEIKLKKFSIIDFYERRARRILPALTIVLTFTTIVSYWVLPPFLLKDYSQSLFSVATFSSNVFFFLRNGYFELQADKELLSHTWSLAIEEQFYLFFPLLITISGMFARKRLLFIITFIAISSFLFALLDNNEANFYLIFSRLWELLLGAIVVFIPSKEIARLTRWQRETIGLFGIVLIFYAIVLYDQDTVFSWYYPLLPVIGTCFVIVFANFNTIAGTLLSNKVFTFFGLISYSLYLWYQPIFALLRIKSVEAPSDEIIIGAIICTVAIAYISWKYIETPFRNKGSFTRVSVFKYAGVSISMFVCLGLLGNYFNGYDSDSESKIYINTVQLLPKTEGHIQIA